MGVGCLRTRVWDQVITEFKAYVTQCEARSLNGEAYSTKETVRGGVLGDVSELRRSRARERMCVFSLLETRETLSQEFLVVAEIPDA